MKRYNLEELQEKTGWFERDCKIIIDTFEKCGLSIVNTEDLLILEDDCK